MTAPVVIFRIERDRDHAGPFDLGVLPGRCLPHRPSPRDGSKYVDTVPDLARWALSGWRFGCRSILQVWQWVGTDRPAFRSGPDRWVIAAYWVQRRHVSCGQTQVAFNAAYAVKRKVLVTL